MSLQCLAIRYGLGAVFIALVCLSVLQGEPNVPKTATGKTPMFYIYEWPEELNDVYPPKNATLHPSSTYDHAFNENGGAGKLLIPELGLFQTWQFSLYKNMMSRLRVSKYRTRFDRFSYTCSYSC